MIPHARTKDEWAQHHIAHIFNHTLKRSLFSLKTRNWCSGEHHTVGPQHVSTAGTTNISRSFPSRSFAHIWKQIPINRNHVLTGKLHKRSLKRVTPWTCASSQIRTWEMKTHRKECQTAHSVSYSLSAKYPLWLPFSLIFLITNDHQKHNFNFSSVHSKK